MKKFLIVSLTSWLIVIIASVVAIRMYLDPQLKILIEEQGSAAIDGTIKVAQVQTQFLPLEVVLSEVTVTRSIPKVSKLETHIESARLGVDILKLLSKTAAVNVKLIKPQVTFESFDSKEAKTKPATAAPSESFSFDQLEEQPYVLALNIGIQDGHVQYKSPTQNLILTDFHFIMDIPSLKSGWDIKTSADITYDKYKIPVFIETILKNESDLIKFSNTKANIAGVDVRMNGEINSKTLVTKVQVESKIPQIQSLQAPIDTGCARLKSGNLDLKLNIATQAQFENPKANGQVTLEKLKTDLKCDVAGASLHGPAEIEAQVVFKYDSAISLEKLVLQTDLSNVDIAYKDLFKKPVQKLLSINIDAAQTNDKIFLKSGNVNLDKLQIKSKGVLSYAPNSSSDIEVTLAKTNLKGTEDFFPILARQPLEGEVELSAKIKGDLTQPLGLNVELNPLSLQNIKASFAWQNKDKTMTLSGPVSLTMNGTLKTQGAQLLQAKLLANIDLRQFEIRSPFFSKSAQSPLSLNLEAEQKLNRIVFKKGMLSLPGGIVQIMGSVSAPQKPLLALNFKTEKFHIEPLIKMMPTMSAYKISGLTDANLNLEGQYDFASGIEKSPLSMKGQLKLNFDNITTPPKPKVAATSPGQSNGESPVPAVPFFSPWPIYKNSNIQIFSNIKNLKYDDLQIRGINTTHSFISGRLLSSGRIQSLFGGQILLKSSSYSMIEAAPPLEFDGTASNIQMSQAVAWVSQEWKDLIRGTASGQFQFKISHPSTKDFLKTSKGNGTMDIKNGFLSTLSFDQMANEKISKIPGVSSRPDFKISSKGAAGDISSVFDLNQGKLNFSKFTMLTPEKNEMQATGWVDLNKTLDMSAHLYLSDPPVKGSVREANSDSMGRLVVPVRISGNVFSPNIDITNDTFKILLEKTAKLEASKLQKKLSQDAQKQAKKIGEDLKKEAEKKLKNLFK